MAPATAAPAAAPAPPPVNVPPPAQSQGPMAPPPTRGPRPASPSMDPPTGQTQNPVLPSTSSWISPQGPTDHDPMHDYIVLDLAARPIARWRKFILFIIEKMERRQRLLLKAKGKTSIAQLEHQLGSPML